ncbi:sensor histidine kinase [Qipengyuania oceanensis]|uniref:histidine kinase n=1 Tax=Qipengyuania oceanensis TaxID=1463597 RepID=A0A844YEL1_9SPHN|nr:PAS domain-containing sensor histidine kinase [Qipengyuania oceanensis]MXO61494.1 PAS domain-containing protein [Qipengyuania oceanensis]
MEFSALALVAIGLLLAAWTGVAAWMMIAASAKARRAEAARKAARRLGRMVEEAPAVPLTVRADGRIEAPERLAHWLGLDKVPAYLSELSGGEGKGLSPPQLEQLSELVRRTQKTAAPFRMSMTVPGSQRALALRGSLADPQVSPSGAAMVWIFDFTESERELTDLRLEAARARDDFAALVGLIEAAPMPMWFRGDDYRLRLVNGAYVASVGASSADAVVENQIELIEPVDGVSAEQIAVQAASRRMPIERVVSATIDGARRTLRVTDLPLIGAGVAGYAVDIEEMEEQAREFRAFREAQRSMLDQLSVGVAQFDQERRLTFANQPFRRIFSLPHGAVSEHASFEQVLLSARDHGRTPEVRDFPAWRAEHSEWFLSDNTHEEAWPLRDGTHLRIVAQPMPDGGLVLIAEDRTEQLSLSATRDTLLRTRTATFDNLYEALAVFSPGGSLELWNRGFASAWGLDAELLDTHPAAERLLQAIAPNLANPQEAEAIGQVVRSATLDRQRRGGQVVMEDERVLQYAGVPLPDGNGMLTVLDVTDSRKAEDALRERNRALEEADAVMTRFLANMSYEFRTPLTSIAGFAEMLASGLGGELPEQAKGYAQDILTSVERLTEQVENVLDLSQSEAGLMPLSKEKVDLMPFVTQIVHKREQAITDGGLTVNLRRARGLEVQADPRQLRRALSQLFDNAIAYTPRGGSILVMLGREGGLTQIVISDNGPGMAQDELARALDGLRAAPDGKGLERRQGLGIPLARQLIEAHDGTLEIVSKKGEGTTVTVRLP